MARYGLFEVANVTMFDLTTNKPIVRLDTLKVSDIENKATTVYAQGGQGNSKILAFDKSREATIKMQDALITDVTMSLMTSGLAAPATGAVTVDAREQLVAVAGTGGTGSEVTLGETTIASVVAIFTGGDAGTGQDITAKGTLTGNKIDFATTDVAVGATVYVYYKFTSDATAETWTVSSNNFPPFIRVVGDTYLRNTVTGVDEKFQFVIPKAKIDPTFTLTLSADGNPTVFDMNLEAFLTDGSTELYHLIKY